MLCNYESVISAVVVQTGTASFLGYREGCNFSDRIGSADTCRAPVAQIEPNCALSVRVVSGTTILGLGPLGLHARFEVKLCGIAFGVGGACISVFVAFQVIFLLPVLRMLFTRYSYEFGEFMLVVSVVRHKCIAGRTSFRGQHISSELVGGANIHFE